MLCKERFVIVMAILAGSGSTSVAEDSSSAFEGRLRDMTARAWGYQQPQIDRGVSLYQPGGQYGAPPRGVKRPWTTH
jgi:hypothetical protein